MYNHLLYIPFPTEAMRYCGRFLYNSGFHIASTPSDDVTHLILPAPATALAKDHDLQQILNSLPSSVTAIGGNLDSPVLRGYRIFDLLKDETYLARNAAITAECSLRIAAQQLPVTLSGTEALILGWGRIGKCLAKLLQSIGCTVTIAARKGSDLAMISALGYRAITYSSLQSSAGEYRIVFNTVPAEVLSAQDCEKFPENCKMIDLASTSGICSPNVIQARGLPGKMVPETSGGLIAQTVRDWILKEEVTP